MRDAKYWILCGIVLGLDVWLLMNTWDYGTRPAPSQVFLWPADRVEHPDGTTVCRVWRDVHRSDPISMRFCDEWTEDPPMAGSPVLDARRDWARRREDGKFQIYTNRGWVP